MKKEEAENLFNFHANKVGLKDYNFGWMKRKTKVGRAGQCNWKKKLIQLQPTYVELNSIEEITNTILHEITHALMPRHNHNKHWRAKAISIGCNGQRCYGRDVIIKKTTPPGVEIIK